MLTNLVFIGRTIGNTGVAKFLGFHRLGGIRGVNRKILPLSMYVRSFCEVW